MANRTVLTAQQDREQRTGGNYVRIPLGNSWNGKGTHMWRLKQERPELFELNEKAIRLHEEKKQVVAERPAGFEPCSREGWLYNKERNVFYQQSTKLYLWYDEAEDAYKPLHEGHTRAVAFAIGATASAGHADEAPAAAAGVGAGAAATAAAPAAARRQAPKHLVISDLHAAARALKIDLGHLDRPAGALAVVGASTCSAASAPPPEATARALPERLLRRLAARRSEWSDEQLRDAVSSTLSDASVGLGGLLPNAALALVVGDRVVAAAAPGTQACVASHRSAASPPARAAGCAIVAPGIDVVAAGTLCQRLGEDEEETLMLALTVGDAAEGLAAATPHLAAGRPRAACVAQVRELRARGARGPLGVGCALLSHRQDPQASDPGSGSGSAGSSASAPPPKRPRTEEAAGQIRVRQILLRHASGAKPAVTARGKPVTRSPEDAEAQLLDALGQLAADGCASFPALCKSLSECQSALRGGEFAGDLGWLDRKSAAKQKDHKTLKVQLPGNVLKVAFELAVGELSDVVASELGAHLLQRTA